MADKKQTDLEKVGALTALGIATSEVVSRIWGALFRATLSEEIVNACLTPLAVALIYFLTGVSGRWKFGDTKGQFISQKWIRLLWGAGALCLVAALAGAWEVIQKRVEKINYFESSVAPTGICATEGAETKALSVRLTLPAPAFEHVVLVCPSSVDENVLAIANSTIELDELGPLPADLRCQRIALRPKTKKHSQFLACIAPPPGQTATGGLELSLVVSDGHLQRVSNKGELKWYEQVGL